MRRFIDRGVVGFPLALAFVLGVPAATPASADRHTCANYPTQAAAQAAYRANPTGLAQLDADRDGIACEDNSGAQDRTPVQLAAPAQAAPAQAAPAQAAPATALPATGGGLAENPQTSSVWALAALALVGLALPVRRVLALRRG